MPDVELAPEGVPEGRAEKEDEEARQFILQVKETIERCLAQHMNKAEMFRVIREEGLPTWIAFAVFKELREQNYNFFKEYYCMHNLKEQREKFGRLIQAYRPGGGNGAAGARALEAVATAAAMMETDTTASMLEEPWLDEELAYMLDSPTGGGDQFAGAGLPQQAVPFPVDQKQPQQAVHFPVAQQPHDDQQTVYTDWLRETPWAEEAVPMLAREQLQNNEQSVANGMFHGVAWTQQAAQPPALPQLPYQEPPVHIPALPQLPYQAQAVQLPAGQQVPYQVQAGQLPAEQQLHYPEHDLPAMQQQLHYQEVVNLPGEHEQQLLCRQYQEQLMANGGFHGTPPALAAALHSDTMMDPWPLSQDGIGWGQERQNQPPKQQEAVMNLPGQQQLQRYQHQEQLTANGGFHGATPTMAAGPPSHTMMDPSSTLPGGELLGYQNLHSSNAGIHGCLHQ